MTKKTQNIILYGFLIYIVCGILASVIFTDSQALSASELQSTAGMSTISSIVSVIVRTAVTVLLWPSLIIGLISSSITY
ncbi:MAG: hypothetical protein WCT27_02655 [Patescibacteria group bacterium]